MLDAWLCNLVFATPEERETFRADKLENRKDPKGAIDVRTRDGRTLRLIDRRTGEGGIVKTIWDLTEDEQLAEELRQARVLAEAGSSAKTEFLSSMSPELRTPLNAVLGFAQLLQRDKKEPLSTRHRERVEQIVKGGEHLLRLIDDILDLSRIEAGGVSIAVEPIEVEDVLETVKTTLGPLAAREGITLVMARTDTPTPLIRADRTRFLQILMNFGSNAIKYNRSKGTVTFVRASPRPGIVRVTVRDTGLGIAADKQGKLFQPFQRAGRETGSIEGTGIGLVITKRLAELMSGEVGFSSVEGQGSEFWVEMPVQMSDNVARSRPPSGAPPERKLGSAQDRSVLYIEDNPANVAFMADLLSSFNNLELLTSPTAEMGIELARAKHPAVVILDINLPGMCGLEALRALRSIPEMRSAPVIALTAAASERDRKRGEDAGFYRYLTKPVKVEQLEALLEDLLSSKG